MIPFAIKSNFDQIWLWQDTEVFKLECLFTSISNQPKLWNKQHMYNCLVFGEEPTHQIHENVRWKLFSDDFGKGQL